MAMAMEKKKWLLPFLLSLSVASTATSASPYGGGVDERAVVEVAGGPEGVVWVAQLSDLHFSVHHQARAADFRRYAAPALAMVNPALVLLTGDLTDGKSKDLLTMKQNEAEWVEYENTIKDVAERSGLPRKIFYDLRGNHDNFGVPAVGGDYDFYRKYSINAKLGRKGHVQSVTLKNSGQKHLFVGIDSTMDIGLRGPTNLFGHPTDKLLIEVDQALSQWDTDFTKPPVTKITFGHFPLSFSALTESGKSLKDVFLKHSLAAYLCGHLHTTFGKNLKRHYHQTAEQPQLLEQYFQYNIRQANVASSTEENCSGKQKSINEFWEWEIGDWRKSRSMRILAIDSGHVSYADVDFRLGSKSIIIVPTFPLDSRFMQRLSAPRDFKCHSKGTSCFETVRTLIFSKNEIIYVSAKIYDSMPGTLQLVLDSEMKKLRGNGTRGDMYVIQWNWRAFADPLPDRYWLQIEAMDVTGDVSYSQLRPFSINGLTAKVSWTWKEFFVMGCQWAAIYTPALWSIVALIFSLLLIPRVSLVLFGNNFTYKYRSPNFSQRTFMEFIAGGAFWLFVELSRMTLVWSGLLVYMMYLLFFPWFFGHPLTEDTDIMYMTYGGWAVKNFNSSSETLQVGTPDVMVIVLSHLCFVVLPATVVLAAMAAERAAYRAHFLSLSGKKEDDYYKDSRRHVERTNFWNGRWIRKFLLLLCLVILWKHWKHCKAIVKAYEMNPLVHSPIYCFLMPAFIALAIYKTSSI